MKRITIFIICLLLTTASTWAQSGMTDNQVMDYVIEQNANGVSRQQIVTQLIQRGVTMDQIRRIQKKYQKQIKNGALGAEDITAGSKAVKTRMREANGEKREEQAKIDQKKASQFRIKDSKMEDYKKKQRRTYDENDKVLGTDSASELIALLGSHQGFIQKTFNGSGHALYDIAPDFGDWLYSFFIKNHGS